MPWAHCSCVSFGVHSRACFGPQQTHSSKKTFISLCAGRTIKESRRLIFRLLLFLTKLLKTKTEELAFHDQMDFFPPVFLLETALPCFVSGVYPQAKSDSVDRHQAKIAVGSLRCVDLGQPQKNGQLEDCVTTQSCSEMQSCHWLDPSWFWTRVVTVSY